MKLTLLLASIICSTALTAQDFYYKNYNWSEKPTKVELSESELLLDNVILSKKQVAHLVLDEKEQAFEYRLLHISIQLNTDAGIENYNTWELSSRGFEVSIQKARVISPDGKIVVQNEKDIKESLDENGQVESKYFAFEGLQKGSVIEIIDLVKAQTMLTGGTFVIEGREAKKSLDIEIITPKTLVYQTYPINGAVDFTLDTLETDKRRIFVHLNDVKAVEFEDWSTYDANLQKIYFKFNRNLNTGKANFYTYATVTQNIYNSIYTPLDKKQLSGIKKYMKSLDLEGLSTEQKIRTIEYDVKKNFYILDQSFENSANLTTIFKDHIMDDNGFYILMINCLKELSIPTELVVTCDRFENKFLTDYEAYNFLTEYLLFIPGENNYLSHHLFNRYGFVPYEFTNQKGLFIQEKQVADYFVGVGKLKDIPTPTSKQSMDELKVRATTDVNAATCTIEVERIGSGYTAQSYQVPLDYLDDKQVTEVKEAFLSYIDDEATFEKSEFVNANTKSFGSGPFSGKGTFTTGKFLERGGDKLLLKVGLLIGPQSELYNRKTRISPVDSPFPRTYNRTIRVVIPDGYSVKNPTDLIMNVLPFGADGSIGFVSNYKVEGSELVVTISEWYNSVHYEANDYSKYESVINGAADFNKIVLILEPK